MEVDNKLEKVLNKINFIERYKTLCRLNQFANNENRLEVEKVLEIIKEFGYSPRYNKSENFFKIVEKESPFQLQFNICVKYGNVELIWDILKNKSRLLFGLGGWSSVVDILTNQRILMPKFRNYEDLREVLKVAFAIYEDFKKELLKQENSQATPLL